MRVVVLCEGSTEKALRQGLREFVQDGAPRRDRLGIDTRSLEGPLMRRKLGRIVELNLAKADVAGVVALTDVYPGFQNANDARERLRQFAGDAGEHANFRAHAAQYEVEAWLLPFWDEIAKHVGVSAKSPGGQPEAINNQRPPSHHLNDLYKRAKQRYEKVIDGAKWLTAERLAEAAKACPELKSFLNSLLEFAGAEALP